MTWFSAMLQFQITVGEASSESWARSLILFRAPDFDVAFARALREGRALEQDYLNGEGERVRWLLRRVETLDALGRQISDGREVYSEPFEGPVSGYDFLPDDERPGSSGV